MSCRRLSRALLVAGAALPAARAGVAGAGRECWRYRSPRRERRPAAEGRPGAAEGSRPGRPAERRAPRIKFR